MCDSSCVFLVSCSLVQALSHFRPTKVFLQCKTRKERARVFDSCSVSDMYIAFASHFPDLPFTPWWSEFFQFTNWMWKGCQQFSVGRLCKEIWCVCYWWIWEFLLFVYVICLPAFADCWLIYSLQIWMAHLFLWSFSQFCHIFCVKNCLGYFSFGNWNAEEQK
jgi:hypothetical protein